jgi:RNA polymerase sigma factor (sigma-70 family)
MAHPSDRDAWSDADLLAGIAARDPDAFAALYRRHLAVLVAFLRKETGDPELAADMAAEVFAAVMVAAPRYRAERATALPWLIGIARNVVGASRRRRRVESRVRRRIGFEPIPIEDADLERTDAIAAEGTGRVTELVATLPPHEREALRARIVDERDYTEIARQLQTSELVVRKRVSRGLARLRQEMKEQ